LGLQSEARKVSPRAGLEYRYEHRRAADPGLSRTYSQRRNLWLSNQIAIDLFADIVTSVIFAVIVVLVLVAAVQVAEPLHLGPAPD
jgi:hypothetical protein